jgi:8-amino-7-oxononanoate synthase
MPSEFHSFLQKQLAEELQKLEERGQRRNLAEIEGVDLCSNDYLGLARNPKLKEAAVAAIQESARTGGTGSRLLSGHSRAWDELEEEFAAFAGTEAALYFGSGYAANIGLLTSLLSKDDIVFSDELNHASLIDGIRLSGAHKVILPHLDLSRLESALIDYSGERCRKLIVTESVFSMDGDVADIEALIRLADKYRAGLIVDEAHATAVHGPSGKGMAAATGHTANVIATVHTCGKALASAGAFVCCSRTLRDYLINRARTFIFTTAMPPYLAGQIRAALHLSVGMDAERSALRGVAREFAASLRQDGWDLSGSTTQIVPAIVGSNEDAISAAEHLQKAGFAVRAIRPPTVPEGRARLRFSLTSIVPKDDLVRLHAALEEWRTRRESQATAARA